MSTSYPSAIDSLTNPNATDPLSSPSHSAQHANANDAIEAIETKLGASGTSFPGSPATGATFYRTDRNIDYYYDGTRWLSRSQHRIALGSQRALFPVSATGIILDGTTPFTEDGVAHWLEKIAINTNVGTLNNASNKWTLQVQSGGGTNIGAAFDTGGDTTGVWTAHLVSSGSVFGSATISVNITTKTGTPGGIFVTAYAVFRLVG